jgi:hypothetical protein
MLFKHITAFIVSCWIFITGICVFLLFKFLCPTPDESKVFVCGNAMIGHTGNKLQDSVFVDGKEIFQMHCASCHTLLKNATGPALLDINSIRSKDWLCKFLTRPGFHPEDKRTITLRRKYGLSCMKFPQLSCAEVQATLTFINNNRL